MKIIVICFSLLLCASSFASQEKLNFAEPELKLLKLSLRQPLQTNLIRLYLRLPSELRMIAGYKEPKSSTTINF